MRQISSGFLADAAEQSCPEDLFNSWIEKLSNPTPEVLLQLLKSIRSWLMENATPFLPLEALDERWMKHSEQLLSAQNDFAKGNLGSENYLPMLNSIQQPLGEILRGILFLRKFQFGFFVNSERRGDKKWQRYHFYPAMGIEERKDAVDIQCQGRIIPKCVVLLDQITGEIAQQHVLNKPS